MIPYRAFAAIPFLAIALLWGGPALSQQPAPESLAAAREMAARMRAADQFKAVLPIIMKQLKPLIAQGRPEVERDYDSLLPVMLAVLEKRSAEVVDATAVVYARHFTVDELRQLTAFYGTAIGQKLLEKLPMVTQESMAAGQKIGEAIVGELQSQMIQELRKRGHKI